MERAFHIRGPLRGIRPVAREGSGVRADRGARRAVHDGGGGVCGREAVSGGRGQREDGRAAAEEGEPAATRDDHPAKQDPLPHSAAAEGAERAEAVSEWRRVSGTDAGGVRQERSGGHRVCVRKHDRVRHAGGGAQGGVRSERAHAVGDGGRRRVRSQRRAGGRLAVAREERAVAAVEREQCSRRSEVAGEGGEWFT